MLFSLEAVEAKQGDSLLLHAGDAGQRVLVLIDGGPRGVYKGTLGPRLQEIKSRLSPDEPLPINLVMVSHIDDDHIAGVLDLCGHLAKQKNKQPFKIQGLWHNAFDDIVGNDQVQLGAVSPAGLRSAFDTTGSHFRPETALVLSSVSQGRRLRDLATNLSVPVNRPFGRLIFARDGAKNSTWKLGGMELQLIAPLEQRVKDLQEEWDLELKKRGIVETAAYLDDSVYNLSSIVVIARFQKKSILLTGDARGDDIVEGLRKARLLKAGKAHFNILKVPHHGSDRNVSTEFFKTVTADHYVISGNGEHGNPEVATLGMLLEARGNARYTIHLTNREKRIEQFLAPRADGQKVKVNYRAEGARSICVNLGDEIGF